MKVLFSTAAWGDYLHWKEQDAAVSARIDELIQDVRRHPFTGIGKPEPLKAEWSGFWSRRITREHRLVYRVEGKGDAQRVEVASCRLHY